MFFNFVSNKKQDDNECSLSSWGGLIVINKRLQLAYHQQL